MTTSRIGTWVVGATLLSLALIAGNLKAAPVEAISVSGAQLQEFGAGYTVGWGFTVSSPIAISSLGWYDPNGTLAGHDVGIYGSTGTLLVSGTGVGTTSLSANGFRYQSLASSIELAAGNYVIGGTTTAAGQYGRAADVTTAAGITYTGGLYAVGPSLSFPTNTSDRGISYFGPSFQLSVAPQISVNFASNGGATAVNAQTPPTAGVVSAANWNDVAMAPQTNLVLKDSVGNSSGLMMSVPAPAFSDSGANFAGAGDSAMMRGHVYAWGGANLDVTFTGKIPYKYYDAYVYYNSGGVTNKQTFSILKSDTSSLGLSKTAYEVPGVDTAYVLSPGTTGNTNNANYVKFSSLSSLDIPQNFILRAQGVDGSPYAYINGLQFVEHARPVISLKFGADVQTAPPGVSKYGVTSIGSSNKAGAVPVSNWNDINTGTLQDKRVLIDSNGDTVSGLTLSTTERFLCDLSAQSSKNIGFDPAFTVNAAGNNALMNGLIYHPATYNPETGEPAKAVDLTFNGKIPYSAFDIYVYYNGGNQSGNTLTFSILDSTGSPLTVPLTKTGKQIGGVESDFALSDGTTAGNYVLFSGLTGASIPENFILRVSGGSTYNYISGMQIVQIPEPGTLLLLATGLIGLLAYAWRKRK